jgi:hypothetical protein
MSCRWLLNKENPKPVDQDKPQVKQAIANYHRGEHELLCHRRLFHPALKQGAKLCDNPEDSEDKRYSKGRILYSEQPCNRVPEKALQPGVVCKIMSINVSTRARTASIIHAHSLDKTALFKAITSFRQATAKSTI